MKKSRIKRYHHENLYCELDGKECTHCCKCDHIQPIKQSSNFLLKLLIACLIISILYLLLFQIVPTALEKHSHFHEKSTNNSMTLEDKVQNYNSQMSNDERAYRNWTGIGAESIGDNYNSIGSR